MTRLTYRSKKGEGFFYAVVPELLEVVRANVVVAMVMVMVMVMAMTMTMAMTMAMGGVMVAAAVVKEVGGKTGVKVMPTKELLVHIRPCLHQSEPVACGT